MSKVVRVSIFRSSKENFPRLAAMMREADAVLCAGIEALPGLVAFHVGEDPDGLALSNVSVWESLEHAKQMDRFAPMLELAKTFLAAGATFERPILNFATLWDCGPSA